MHELVSIIHWISHYSEGDNMVIHVEMNLKVMTYEGDNYHGARARFSEQLLTWPQNSQWNYVAVAETESSFFQIDWTGKRHKGPINVQ